MNKNNLAILNGTLIDGMGKDPVEDSTILIKNQKIAAVGERGEFEIPENTKKIDVEGAAVIPGLIDAHLHFSGSRPGEGRLGGLMIGESQRAIRAAMDAYSMLKMGYTGARDCGSTLGIYMKRAIEEGTIQGPRIMSSGMFVHNTFGHVGPTPLPLHIANAVGQYYADGVDECLKTVRSRLREGADFIKIASGLYGESRAFPKCMPSYSFEEIKAITDEAHRAYTIVAAHCQGKEGIITSLNAGVDTIEHGSEFDEECAILIKKQNKIFVPNVYIQTEVLDAPIIRDRYSEEIKKALEKGYYDSVYYALKHEVKIASGSDFSGGDSLMGLAMGKNAAELGALVKAGLTPVQAIEAATKNAAEAMLMEDKIGTIEKGKLADIVVVNGDPMENVKILMEEKSIGMVLKGGEIIVKRI